MIKPYLFEIQYIIEIYQVVRNKLTLEHFPQLATSETPCLAASKGQGDNYVGIFIKFFSSAYWYA